MTIETYEDFLELLKNSPQDFFIIHYACQGFSLGITSIAIKDYKIAKTYNYSIHAIAKELDIKEEYIKSRLEEIELELLRRFYKLVKKHKHKYWVHWNMRDQGFGFEHLEHRYRVLAKKNAPEIPAVNRINLNDMLAEEHGGLYAGNPKMSSLMKINGDIYRNFLEGKEEVQAFKTGEFDCIERSTSTKVGFFGEVMKKMTKGTLKTATSGYIVVIDKFLATHGWKFIYRLFSLLVKLWIG